MNKVAVLAYIVVFAVAIFLLSPIFYQNITFLLNPQDVPYIFQGRWDWVLLYIAIFGAFSFFLFYHPLRKGSWKKSTSIYVAFIIALFTEMFGIPLTVYFLSSLAPPLPQSTASPAIAFTFNIFGTTFNLLLTSLIAGIISIVGMILIVLGWKSIYKSKGLVTDGIYAYTRHPQYLGIMLIVTAWLFAWPTLITMITWPILVIAYYKLSRIEEKDMIKEFGQKYVDYRKNVSMLLPFL